MNFQMRQTISRSFVVFLWTLAVACLFNLQYSLDQRFTIFFLNKTIANTAIILIASSYIFGPLCILFPKLAKQLGYRRYLGVFGFIALMLHVLFSFLQWFDRFPLSWYIDHRIGVTAAVIAFVIFTELALTSHNELIKALGTKQWKFIQRLGYIGLILGLFHVYVASGDRWGQWFAGEVSMPNSFVTFVSGVVVIVIRLLALLHDSFSKRKHR